MGGAVSGTVPVSMTMTMTVPMSVSVTMPMTATCAATASSVVLRFHGLIAFHRRSALLRL